MKGPPAVAARKVIEGRGSDIAKEKDMREQRCWKSVWVVVQQRLLFFIYFPSSKIREKKYFQQSDVGNEISDVFHVRTCSGNLMCATAVASLSRMFGLAAVAKWLSGAA